MKLQLLHLHLRVFLVLSAVLVVAWCKCREPVNLYDDLKCKPIYRSDDHHHRRCPKAFDCGHIRNDNNKCFFNGKYYGVGQSINEWDQNLPTCVAQCTCDEDLNFQCAVYDCEFNPPPPHCYNTYDLRRCCPTGVHCPNQNTLKCRGSDHQIFKYGQIFESPSVSCAVCECYPGYTGKPKDPHCKKAICDAEVYQNQMIQSFCAPVYLWKGDCCPNDFLCPSPLDEWEDFGESVAASEDSSSDDHDSSSESSVSSSDRPNTYRCRYGENNYYIGAQFKRKDIYDEDHDLYTRCECIIPPYFTCIRDLLPDF